MVKYGGGSIIQMTCLSLEVIRKLLTVDVIVDRSTNNQRKKLQKTLDRDGELSVHFIFPTLHNCELFCLSFTSNLNTTH